MPLTRTRRRPRAAVSASACRRPCRGVLGGRDRDADVAVAGKAGDVGRAVGVVGLGEAALGVVDPPAQLEAAELGLQRRDIGVDDGLGLGRVQRAGRALLGEPSRGQERLVGVPARLVGDVDVDRVQLAVGEVLAVAQRDRDVLVADAELERVADEVRVAGHHPQRRRADALDAAGHAVALVVAQLELERAVGALGVDARVEVLGELDALARLERGRVDGVRRRAVAVGDRVGLVGRRR